MPSWVTTVIEPAQHEVETPATEKTIESDPSVSEQHGLATSVRSFLDVENLDAGGELRVYRYMGASAEQMRLLDTPGAYLTVTPGALAIETVRTVEWDEPLGAYGKIQVKLVRNSGTKVMSTFRVVQAYLVEQ